MVWAYGLPGEALAGAPDHVRVRRHPADIIRRLERGVSPPDDQHGLVGVVGRVDGHLGVGRDELGAADLGDLGDGEALVVQQVLSEAVGTILDDLCGHLPKYRTDLTQIGVSHRCLFPPIWSFPP